MASKNRKPSSPSDDFGDLASDLFLVYWERFLWAYDLVAIACALLLVVSLQLGLWAFCVLAILAFLGIAASTAFRARGATYTRNHKLRRNLRALEIAPWGLDDWIRLAQTSLVGKLLVTAIGLSFLDLALFYWRVHSYVLPQLSN